MKQSFKTCLFMCLSMVMTIVYSMQMAFGQTHYKIATDITFAPFEWKDTSGELVGIDMDILRAIEKVQNVTFDIAPLGFNAALQAVESGQADGVLAGMSITPARQQTFDFSEAYYESGVSMAVAANSQIADYTALAGQKVSVKTGTQGASFADSIKETYGFEVVTFEDSASMYQDVISGNSAAVFEDSAVMSYAIKDQKLPLKLVGEMAQLTEYGFAVSKNKQSNLLRIFNEGLAQIKASGEYDRIIQKYVGTQNENTENEAVEDTSIIGVIQTNASVLLTGLVNTLLLTASAIAIALIIGVILGLFSVSHRKVLTFIYTVYVDIMRGTPLIVFAFFVYFALPQFFGFKYTDAFLPSVITLSLNAAAYIGELFRGGILSVDKGQFEAAHSLGLPYGKTMRHVILPQAFKVMVPPFINQFVMTLKDTSILSAIGLVELTQTGKLIIARTYASGNTWLVIALMYICIITLLTKLSKIVEKKWHV